jgi:hypothetical protein
MNGFIDVQTLAGFNPQACYYNPTTGRLFIIQTPATSAPIVALWNFNNSTGVNSYVGKITLNLGNAAATTHTVKGFCVNDSGSNYQIIVSTTGSVAINGGTYVAYVPLTAFTAGGTSFFAASGSGQQAIYFLQANDSYGVTNNLTTTWGVDSPFMSATGAINTKVYTHNNTIAVPQVAAWDLATTPNVAGQLSSISSFTSAIASTTPNAFYSVASNAGYQNTAAGEPICSLSGAPANITNWSPGTLQVAASNVYFMRDAQQLNTFTVTSLSGNLTAGATYTITGTIFTWTIVLGYSTGATTIVGSTTTTLANAPTSGTLTLASGAGPATIAFSSYTTLYAFNLATTSGGAAVTPTSAVAGTMSILRAFGTSTNTFYGRTPVGGYAPTLGGAIIANNVVNYAKPISAPQNTALQGADCLALSTTTTLALGKISDLFISISGTTSGSTLTTASTTGVANGQAVIGPGIAPGTTVSSFVVNTSITLSLAVFAAQGSAQTFILGAVNWSSLTQSNILGTGVDIVAPVLAVSRYGAQGYASDFDKFLYSTNTSTFIAKALQNSVLYGVCGGIANAYMETVNPTFVQFGLTALSSIENRAGWGFLCGSSTGQRGVVYMDLASDDGYGYSCIISPVAQLPAGSTARLFSALRTQVAMTNEVLLWVRSSLTNGATFSSGAIPTVASPGNWTQVNYDVDYLNSIALNSYVQVAITFQVMGTAVQTVQYAPSQVIDMAISANIPGETSDNWVWSVDHTSQSANSPMYVSGVLQKAYGSAPSVFRLVGYDSSGNQQYSINTTSNASQFQQSSNNGTSYTTFSNMATWFGSYNTINVSELKITITSPPAVAVVRWSLLDV